MVIKLNVTTVDYCINSGGKSSLVIININIQSCEGKIIQHAAIFLYSTVCCKCILPSVQTIQQLQ